MHLYNPQSKVFANETLSLHHSSFEIVLLCKMEEFALALYQFCHHFSPIVLERQRTE